MAISFQPVTGAVGQEASAIAKQFGLSANQLETLPPPDGNAVIQGDIFFIPCHEHTVVKGDTILSIWTKTCPQNNKKSFSSMAFLAAVKQLNPDHSDQSFNLIEPGDTLKIPAFEYTPDGTTPPLNQSIVAQGDKKISALREALGVTAELDAPLYDALFDDTNVLAHFLGTYDDSAEAVNDLSAKVFYVETLAEWASAEGLDPNDTEGNIEQFQTQYLQLDTATGMNDYGSNDLPGLIGEDTLSALDEFYQSSLLTEEWIEESGDLLQPITNNETPKGTTKSNVKLNPEVGSTSASHVQEVKTSPKKQVPGETPPWADDYYIVDQVRDVFIYNIIIGPTSQRAVDTAHWVTLNPPNLQTEYDNLTGRFVQIARENSYDPESNPDYYPLKQDWQRFISNNENALRKCEITKAKESIVHGALFQEKSGYRSRIATDFNSVAEATIMGTKLPTEIVDEYRDAYRENIDEVRYSDLWQVYYQPLLDQYTDFVENSPYTQNINYSDEQFNEDYDFNNTIDAYCRITKNS